jgi:hypothetical protein
MKGYEQETEGKAPKWKREMKSRKQLGENVT